MEKKCCNTYIQERKRDTKLPQLCEMRFISHIMKLRERAMDRRLKQKTKISENHFDFMPEVNYGSNLHDVGQSHRPMGQPARRAQSSPFMFYLFILLID